MITKDQIDTKKILKEYDNVFLNKINYVEKWIENPHKKSHKHVKNVSNALSMLLFLSKEFNKLMNEEKNEYHELFSSLTLLSKKDMNSLFSARSLSAKIIEPSLLCVSELYKKFLGQQNNSTAMCKKFLDWSNTKIQDENDYIVITKSMVGVFILVAMDLDSKIDAMNNLKNIDKLDSKLS